MDIIIDLENCKNSNDLFKLFSDILKINPPINKKWDAFCDTLFCIFADSLLIREKDPTFIKYMFKNIDNYKNFDHQGYLNLINIFEKISRYKIISEKSATTFSFEIGEEKIEFSNPEDLFVNEGHPFLNLDGDLPYPGMVFKAERTEGNKRIFSKFIKCENGIVYYTDNHFGDIDNGQPPFSKIK